MPESTRKKITVMAHINELYVGAVVKMNPTPYSHVRLPYFAKVIDMFGGQEFMLSIPGQHTLKVSWAGRNIDYHLNRMEVIGPYDEFAHLLYNQTFE